MTFLAPALLLGLPLAALPVVIHLIHLYRRRSVPWAAMMFLQAAQRMNKGLSRLRQIAILALRVLAIAAVIFVITRPLAGGWLGLTGGAPDTVLILLDRSASMEQQNAATGVSKRAAGLHKLARAINDAVGTRSRLVLIDSALLQPLVLGKANALTDLPQTEGTDTAADVPALMQAALDYITVNKTGRTDVWLLSDLQQSNWDAASGRWEALRGAFGALQGVRFHLLCYSEAAPDDLGVNVDRVVRRETGAGADLLLDLRLTRHAANPQPLEVPLRFVVNGVATAAKVTLKENQLQLQGYALPIDKNVQRGWGRVELPADAWPANNVFNFVFDEPPVLRSVIVSDDPAVTEPLDAALSAAADPSRKYAVTVLATKQAAEIPWTDTAFIVWQAPVPKAGEALAHQLRDHVAAGRAILFLPPEIPDGEAIYGLHWAGWTGGALDKPQSVEWWRNDADLLANTRDGAALPVGTLEILRRCGIAGEGVPLARVAERQPLLERAATEGGGSVYFLGTLPGPGGSSLARDGVTLFALLHRALNEGADSLAKAQQRFASARALGPAGAAPWRPVEQKEGEIGSAESLPLHAGVVAAGDRLIALNRPPGEDQPQILSRGAVGELFAGLDFRLVADTLEDSRSLTNEIWRTFLLAMAVCLLGEALLCLPPRRELPTRPRAEKTTASPPPAVAANAA